jgi:aconitate hydratase
VRDLAGKPVSQAILGGDGGVTLRDLFAVSMLLKSKRVPSRLDFLFAVPSRQMLEVLGAGGALTDLVATGARLVEPDGRIATGTMYPPTSGGLSVRTFEMEPRLGVGRGHQGHIVASAETVAAVVATGEITDPRSFKRPVRVTVPRVLPTDDVLVVRDRKGTEPAAKREPVQPAPLVPWKASLTVDVLEAQAIDTATKPALIVCASPTEARAVANRVLLGSAPHVRAVLASPMPSPVATLLAAAGVLPLEGDPPAPPALGKAKPVALAAPTSLTDAPFALTLGSAKVQVTCRANAAERSMIAAGGARTPKAKG